MKISRKWVDAPPNDPQSIAGWVYDAPVQVAAEALAFYGLDLAELDNWIEAGGDERAHMLDWRARAIQSFVNRNPDAMEAWAMFLRSAMHMIGVADFMRPLAKHGKVMKSGRKVGTVGAVRKFVRAHLAKDPQASAAVVWRAIAEKPPRHVEVYEESGRIEKYIRTSGQGDTSYRQFCNIVSAERPKKA